MTTPLIAAAATLILSGQTAPAAVPLPLMPLSPATLQYCAAQFEDQPNLPRAPHHENHFRVRMLPAHPLPVYVDHHRHHHRHHR